MKDLQHLYYFEKLLEEVNNDLVREAQNKGSIAIGAVCFQIPEPLINLPGCFSVRLRAPRTGSIEMGTYYMSSMLCEGCRAILERAIEGGFEFLDCIIAPDACAQMNRCVENIERQNLCSKEKFFVEYSDVPMKDDETALRHYVRQMREHVLEPLNKVYGIDISDEALRKSVDLQNKISRLITQIGDYRKEDNPRITGYEFAVLCLATYCCPKEALVEKLEDTLKELGTRQPDDKKNYRAKVVMVGSEIDNPELIKLCEEAGGGPFLTYNQDGTVSLQILESSQIDKNNEEYMKMFTEGTHFNPVDLVCATKDYQGNAFDLPKFVDPSTGFISSKSKNGKDLKALELPGLWNGAMSDWNTVFVEVPLGTFNPVKTVNDLLRDQHQAVEGGIKHEHHHGEGGCCGKH